MSSALMDSFMLFIFVLTLNTVCASNHVDSAAEAYWKTILPKTPIPSSIKELMHSDETYKFELEKTVYPAYSYYRYKWSATENQVRNDPNAALFFLKASLSPGTSMALELHKTLSAPPFLAAADVATVPFSTRNFPAILSRFSLAPSSPEAAAVSRTLAECEELSPSGERKRCATSLESMADFVAGELGNNVRVSETAVVAGGEVARRQKYRVVAAAAVKDSEAGLVACHPEPFPAALYYCHTAKSIEAYDVRMEGEDGTAVEAVATCHVDTSEWSPGYIGLRVLKVKPGGPAVCHFLPQGHLIFTRLPEKKKMN